MMITFNDSDYSEDSNDRFLKKKQKTKKNLKNLNYQYLILKIQE